MRVPFMLIRHTPKLRNARKQRRSYASTSEDTQNTRFVLWRCFRTGYLKSTGFKVCAGVPACIVVGRLKQGGTPTYACALHFRASKKMVGDMARLKHPGL